MTSASRASAAGRASAASRASKDGTDTEVAIAGGGVAGLAAARALAAAGVPVRVLEARNRLGGRIYTRHEAGLPVPIELGAAFIHGAPEEILGPARAGAFPLEEITGRRWERWQFQGGILAPVRRVADPPGTDEIYHRLWRAAASGPDRAFQDFLDWECAEEWLREARRRVTRYVQGYHAARPDRISIQGLVKGEEADEAIESGRQFRIAGGYDRLVAWLASGIPPGAIALETVVTEVRWQPGHVVLVTRPAGAPPGTATAEVAARRAIITLPLGVLQQPAEAPGGVRFTPVLPEKAAALRGLEMGAALRIVLRFDQSFWKTAALPTLAESAGRPGSGWERGARRIGSIAAPEERIPLWWTAEPDDVPLLAGWLGGPEAARLSEDRDDTIVAVALDVLGRVFGLGRDALQAGLRGWYFHNWQADPYSRGAYSYVLAGGLPCQEALARPVERTLFFAGEATECNGHYSTVHGAIATGRRAAREILDGG